MLQKAKIEQAVQQVTHAAMNDETGLLPDFEIPVAAYHYWPAHYRRRAEESGMSQAEINSTDWYAIWDDPQFVAEFKRDNPGLCYREERQCQQSSIIVPATKWTKIERRAA